MNEVTTQDMMDCREHRAALQASLRRQFPGNPVLSFCMNIPGPIKTDDEIRSAFEVGKNNILSALLQNSWQVEQEYEVHEKTGDEWIASIQADAIFLKQAMCAIEEKHPLGRLFDIDIIDTAGEKLTRTHYRTCLICQKQALDCARSRCHSISELFVKVKELIHEGIP